MSIAARWAKCAATFSKRLQILVALKVVVHQASVPSMGREVWGGGPLGMHRAIKTCLQATIIVAAIFGATNLSAENAPAGPSSAPTAAPAAGGETKTGTGCNTILKPANPGGASVIQPEGESIQRKNWQPTGGEIQFTVKSFEPIPPEASVVVCFRWKAPSKKGKAYEEAQVSKIDLDSDKKTLKVTAAVPGTLGDQPNDIETAVIPFVPLAEVRILAINNKTNTAAVDASTTIGITHVWAALGFAVATVVVGFWVLYMLASLRLKDVPGINQASWPLQVISTPSGYASLSQLQIILWTLVVAASTVYVMSLNGQLIQITNGTLVLLGIAGAAGLAAKAHSESQTAATEADAAKAAKAKVDADVLKAEKAAAAAAPPPDPAAAARIKAESEAAAKDAADKDVLAAQAKKKADEIRSPPKTQIPQWSDLIVNETTLGGETKSREIDVTRFQMLVFTLITATFVLMNVLATYVIPEISNGFLTLMGISNGVYVGSKIVQRS